MPDSQTAVSEPHACKNYKGKKGCVSFSASTSRDVLARKALQVALVKGKWAAR